MQTTIRLLDSTSKQTAGASMYFDTSHAYESLDRFLRNNLHSDADYSEYSAYLDTVLQHIPMLDAHHPAVKSTTLVNGGALVVALNALRRAGKNEIADELEKTVVQP